MVEKRPDLKESIENLRPLDVTELNGLKTDFNLFLEIAGKAVLYAEGPHEWSVDEIQRLNHDGFSVLFYSKVNASKVSELLDLDLAVEEPSEDPEFQAKVRHITELLNSCRNWIDSVDLTKQQRNLVNEASVTVLETITESETLLKHLNDLSEHDYYTFYHSIRTAAYGVVIAAKMDTYDVDQLHDIMLACVLHDLGHLKVDKSILEKKERLNDREWFEIKQHPLHTLELIKDVPIGAITKDMVAHHHEREDGHGYPFGIEGKEISQEVKILAFCDIFDALTSPRPYQKPITFEEAVHFIEENALEYLDKKSFEAMKTLIKVERIKVPA